MASGTARPVGPGRRDRRRRVDEQVDADAIAAGRRLACRGSARRRRRGRRSTSTRVPLSWRRRSRAAVRAASTMRPRSAARSAREVVAAVVAGPQRRRGRPGPGRRAVRLGGRRRRRLRAAHDGADLVDGGERRHLGDAGVGVLGCLDGDGGLVDGQLAVGEATAQRRVRPAGVGEAHEGRGALVGDARLPRQPVGEASGCRRRPRRRCPGPPRRDRRAGRGGR